MGIGLAVAGGLTAGALSGGSSLLGGLLSAKNAKEINEYNQMMALNMSNTAHQREVKDLIAAGLNPWLSVQNGGASGASGAMFSDTSSAKHINEGFQGLSKAFSDLTQFAITQAKVNSALALDDKKMAILEKLYNV